MDSLVEADQELAINTKRFRNLPRRVIIASKIIPEGEGKVQNRIANKSNY